MAIALVNLREKRLKIKEDHAIDGTILLPTYMNQTRKGKTNRLSGIIGKAGADFKQKFTPDTYREFIGTAGYTDVRYILCDGRIPCAVAVIKKNSRNKTPGSDESTLSSESILP